MLGRMNEISCAPAFFYFMILTAFIFSPNILRIFHTLRKRIPFIQPYTLLKFCLFQSQCSRSSFRSFQKFVYPSLVALSTRNMRSHPTFSSH